MDTLTDNQLAAIAESRFGFIPTWCDDGESILGIALWEAPNGTLYTATLLYAFVRARLAADDSAARPTD